MCSFHTILSYGNSLALVGVFTPLSSFHTILSYGNLSLPELSLKSAQSFHTILSYGNRLGCRLITNTLTTFHTILSYGNRRNRTFQPSLTLPLSTQFCPTETPAKPPSSLPPFQLSTQFCPTETCPGPPSGLCGVAFFPHNSVLRKRSGNLPRFPRYPVSKLLFKLYPGNL